jgi:hypothetical protein
VAALSQNRLEVANVGLLGIYMILLFLEGKLPSRRWRPFAWFAGAVMALICVLFIFVPGPLVDHEGAQNPLGLEWLAWVADARIFIILLLSLCILASALSLMLRYRRSEGEVREQIKWLSLRRLLYMRDLHEQPARPDPLRAEVSSIAVSTARMTTRPSRSAPFPLDCVTRQTCSPSVTN